MAALDPKVLRANGRTVASPRTRIFAFCLGDTEAGATRDLPKRT